MKIAGRKREYSHYPWAAWLLIPLLGLPASCSSLSLEDTVPAARPVAAAQRPTQPDGYPNLNVPVQAASPQLSETDRQRLVGELESLRQGQAAGAGAAQALSEEERLRLIARSHGERVLGEIEASQQ